MEINWILRSFLLTSPLIYLKNYAGVYFSEIQHNIRK